MTMELDRAACVVKGYKIRAAIDDILEVTDEYERREFNEDVIRPNTLRDVSQSVELLRGEVHTLSECGYDAATVEALSSEVTRAASANDAAAMTNAITRIWSAIKSGAGVNR